MSVYGCTGVLLLQFAYQVAQRFDLRGCPGVFRRLVVSSQASDITDTDTICIMPGAVCAYLLYRSAGVYASVPVDNVMVADTLPATRFVPAVNRLLYSPFPLLLRYSV